MTSASTAGRAVVPSLSADDLLKSVPGLDGVAEVHTTTLSTVPGASLTLEDTARVLHWARVEAASGVDGAVIIQGTDTIEETAYFWDLYWDSAVPVVVTGAMRPPQLAGADGPANLLASIRVAIDASSRHRGVLVVLNDEIHSARRVRKVNSSLTNAFASPSFGPLGYVHEGSPVYGSPSGNRSALVLPEPFVSPKVALLTIFLGDAGDTLATLTRAGLDGAVIAGFGVGHTSPSLALAIEQAAASFPVVLASRTGSGSTHRNSYGFPGSESDVIAKGAIPAGWLDARKARVLLAGLLAGKADAEEIRAEFENRGAALH
ncbi:asparaginase [soil metagenome]